MSVPISISDSNGTTFLQALNSAFDETIQHIGTIAALRTTTPTSTNMIVAVTGYYTAADNIGVREYYWDATSTEADDGCTIIAVTGATTGRWKMKYSGAVNVKWFGAKGDGIADDTIAIQSALNCSIRNAYFPIGVYLISSTLVTSGLYQSIIGEQFATSTASYAATVLKWSGISGGTILKAQNGHHGFNCSNISFDCNNIADIGLHLEANTGESLQFPTLEKLTFAGYLKAGLVLGANNTTTLHNGQLQQCSMRDISWKGSGASAIATSVYGLILNAQNCEFLTLDNVYFDPFTSVGGGPYMNHYNHILCVSGGLTIRSMTGTRATSYAIQVVSECGLNIDGYRAEDIKLISFPDSAGLPSSSISIKNINHRSGLATGLDDAIVIQHSGMVPTTIENCIITGNVKLGTNVAKNIMLKNISYRTGTSGTGATILLGPIVSTVSLEEVAGSVKRYNTVALEEWRSSDGLSTLLFKNDAGKLAKVRSISGSGTAANNLGGVITIASTSASTTFTFPTAEPDTSYRILATPIAIAGTPAAGANRPYTTVRNTTDFTLTVEVAPGAGNSVTFAWMLFRA